MASKYIEEAAESTLIKHSCFSIPVDLFKCANQMGIELSPMEANDDFSGVFIFKNGKAQIGYNKDHHENRQRFTIAHEIGHYTLHNQEDTTLFVDKAERVMYRDKNLTQELKKEREANEFAAALLMPEKLVKDEFIGVDGHKQDQLVTELAAKFKVSQIAMTIRLANLGLIEYGL